MTKKLSFALENAELIKEEENSKFSILSLDFFSSGANRNETYISEETLDRTANSIKNAPLVWKYDPTLDDAYTHDPEEVPCGFIPESSEIKRRKLPDGRTMLSAIAYVWKRYSGPLLDFFRRDENQKPVSVEVSVFGTQDRPDGLIELTDFRYECVTILGTFVSPAIPGANATVLQYAAKEREDYEHDYQLEFGKYDELSFEIPTKVRENAKNGLERYRKTGRGGSSVSLALSRHLVNSDFSNADRVRNLAKILNRFAKKDLSNEESDDYISFLSLGGSEAFDWATGLAKKIEEIDNRQIAHFGAKEEIDVKIPKNKEEFEEKPVEEEKKEEEFQEAPAEDKKEEEKEDPKEEEKETPEEEDKEEKPEEKKEKYSLDAAGDTAQLQQMLADETEMGQKVAAEFAKTEEERDYAYVLSAACQKMCKMMADYQEMCNKYAEKEEMCNKMAAENEDLKSYKQNNEDRQFQFAVDAALNEVSADMPKDKLDEWRGKAKEFENIDGWRNALKAEAYQFSKSNQKIDDGVTRIDLPFNHKKNDKKSIWD